MTFPRLEGYKWEVPDEHLEPQWTEDSRITLNSEQVPTSTEVAGVVGATEVHTLDDLKEHREQEVAFELAKDILTRYFEAPTAESDGQQNWRPWLYPQLVRISREWMKTCLRCQGNAFPQLLLIDQYKHDAADHIYRSIVAGPGGEKRLVAILRAYDPIGDTDHVDFDTSKPVRSTDPSKCHLNYTVADSRWEHRVEMDIEDIPEVLRYVKNQGLGFTIPYNLDGEPRSYYPDFLVDLRIGPGDDDVLHVILEVSGERDREKQIKIETARNLWIPAVNNARQFGRWYLTEVTDPFEAADMLKAIVAEMTTVGGS
jgi:type III restriction enzyme